MVKQYKNEADIKRHLKQLDLEKQIAWEELKGCKNDFKETLQPYQWMQTGFSILKKYSIMMLVKKIIK
ncbi:hypothetical protein PK35_15960 [Tamlana nanhaiensis]|uniref:Uncharacterized protein n=2 Tax=Neotamlana TaxID=3400367 RepID=A0A0D7VZV1_9FLAO|nr:MULTISPECIES: hypothetical protein [Tamlana]KJD31137.1 hypothetical protein PK35_15960 [Tamlana nanhaiensis]MCB4808089.1 hypothetical protein [Tamlana sargassicola]